LHGMACFERVKCGRQAHDSGSNNNYAGDRVPSVVEICNRQLKGQGYF
jgi:hypothetical protein